MAYTPSLEDISDLHKTQGGYSPSLADIGMSPQEKVGAVQQVMPAPGTMMRGFETGAAEAGRGIANLLRKLPGISSISQPIPEGQTQLLSPQEQKTLAGRVGKFAGESAPMSATGPASSLLEGAGLSPALAAAGAMGGYSAATTPGTAGQRAMSGAVGAGAGALGDLAVKGISKIPGSLSKFVGGSVSPEQFEAARAAVPEGIKLPIGDLADSARAQQLYGTTTAIAGSGANRPYQQLNEFLKNKQSEILGDVPVDPQDINQSVYKDVYNKYTTAKENTHDAYDALANSADGDKTPFKNDALQSELSDKISGLKSKMTTKAAKNLYQPHIDAMEDFANADFKNFKSATDQIPVVNDLLSDARGKNDRLLTRTYTGIKKGLEQSIKDSSEQNAGLLDLYQGAKDARIHQGTFEQLNKKDFTPFYKTYIKDGDPSNLVNQYVKSSKGTADHSGLLESLTSKIGDDTKKALSSAYLKSDTFPQFAKKLGGLNAKQRGLLLGEHAPDAEHLLRLSKDIPNAKIAGFVPKTGFTGGKGVQAGVSGLGALQALLSGHPATAAVYAGGMPLLGQVTQRALRSDALKDAYAKSLQKSMQAQNAPTSGLLRNLSKALALQGAQKAGGQ